MRQSLEKSHLNALAVNLQAGGMVILAVTAMGFALAATVTGHAISLAIGLAAFCAVLVVLSVAAHPPRALPLLIVTIPLVSVGVIEAGWSIRPVQVMVLMLLVAFALTRHTAWSPLPVRRMLVVYIVSLGLAAILGIVLGSSAEIGVVSEVRLRASVLRPLAQFVTIGLGLVVLPFMWRLLESEREITRAMRAMLVISGLIALYGLYQPIAVAYGLPLTDITQAFSFGQSAVTRYGETRFYEGIVASFAPRATFAESLHFGAYLAGIFPVTFACWLGRDRLPQQWRRWPWASLTLLFGIVILLTLSRSSWIAAGFAAAIVLVAAARPKAWLLAGAGMGGLYLLLLAFSHLAIFDSTLSPLALLGRRLSALDLAADPRWLYHSVLYGLVAQNPLWGIGLGNFALRAAAELRMDTLASAHSVWLAHLVEGGIIGLGALLALVAAVMKRLFAGLRAGRDGALSWYYPLLGICAGLAAMSAQYLTFGDRFDPHFWFWAAVGLRLSAMAVMQEPPADSINSQMPMR